MKYNFDQIHNRKDYNSVKWNELKEKFGTKDLIPFWIADMDFKSPQPVINRLIEAAQHGIYGYTRSSKTYFNAVINWMQKRQNWEIKKEWITVAPGVIPALGFIIRIFTQPGDKVIIQPPVYPPFFDIILKNGRNILANPLILKNNKYYMNFTDLEKKIKDPRAKILILCSPHNPVGRVWRRDELIELGKICIKHNVLIISDEIHADIIYPGFKHTPFASISQNFSQNSITCTSPSKTFNLAGLKTANIIIPNKELFRVYDNLLDSLHLGENNYFGLFALEAAYQEGEDWLDQLLNYLYENLQFLKGFIKIKIPKINIIEPEGSYLVWVDFRSLNLDSAQIRTLMIKKAKVVLNDGYRFGREGEGFERISIGCPREILKNGIEKIKYAIDSVEED